MHSLVRSGRVAMAVSGFPEQWPFMGEGRTSLWNHTLSIHWPYSGMEITHKWLSSVAMDKICSIASSVGVVFIFVLSFHALRYLVQVAQRAIAGHRPLELVYNDRDGEATKGSIRRASKKTTPLAILSFSCFGLAVCTLKLGLIPNRSSHSTRMWCAEMGSWVRCLWRFSS